ncbi:MAG: enolase C-terminal domain-like protein [Candidatus Krumholzibacteriia bacterium]
MDLRWRRRTFPLIRPIEVGGVESRKRTVIELQLDGRWSEVSPLPGLHHEPLEALPPLLPGALALLRQVHGTYLEQLAALNALPAWSALPPSLRCGLEGALMVVPDDLERPGSDMPPTALLVDQDPTEPLDHLSGVRCVKVKVGRRALDAELALLARVRATVAADAELRLDANRAFTLDEAVAFTAAVGEAPASIEEPLRDPRELPEFIARTGWPVALDESLHEPSLRHLRTVDGVVAWVIKPTLLGVYHTLALFDQAPAGVACVVSASFEGPVGLGLLMELAEVAPGCPSPGLGTVHWLADDGHASRWTEVR